MHESNWEIGRTGRSWYGDEVIERHNLLPESTKIELHEGKLLQNDDERLTVVAMLLENLGIDKILPLFDSDILLEALIVHQAGEEKFKEILEALEESKQNDDA